MFIKTNFGLLFFNPCRVIPQYLIYRPANSVPYATVEADLKGQCLKYCTMDPKGKLITRTVGSEVEQKCSAFQHWIHQWTHGNLLVTQVEGGTQTYADNVTVTCVIDDANPSFYLAGVETKLTNIRVVTKSKGFVSTSWYMCIVMFILHRINRMNRINIFSFSYQGLTESGSPEVFEQFLMHHQCNYYCGLLGLIPFKTLESLQPPKPKGSRSPLLNRKLGSSSPQMQRKGQSPQMSRKAHSSPKVARKVQETEDAKLGSKSRPTEASVVEMR